MKKFVAAITIACYLVVTSGIIVNFHYCMNRLASADFFKTESKKCARCGMNLHKSKSCCHDEVKIVKLQVDQKAPHQVSFELPALDEMVAELSAFITLPVLNAGESRHFYNHSPPLLSDQDTYLQNRVFRI